MLMVADSCARTALALRANDHDLGDPICAKTDWLSKRVLNGALAQPESIFKQLASPKRPEGAG